MSSAKNVMHETNPESAPFKVLCGSPTSEAWGKEPEANVAHLSLNHDFDDQVAVVVHGTTCKLKRTFGIVQALEPVRHHIVKAGQAAACQDAQACGVRVGVPEDAQDVDFT